MSNNANTDKGRFNQDSLLNKMDDPVSAEEASLVNGGVAFLGVQASTPDLRVPLRDCCRMPPAGVRTWSPPRSVPRRTRSPLASSDGLRSHGILDHGILDQRRVGKPIAAKRSATRGSRSATVGGSRSLTVGGNGSAVVSGSPIRIVSRGISRSAAVPPGPGLPSTECMSTCTLKTTVPKQFSEANQIMRQTSAPLWKQVPVVVAELLVTGLATGRPYGPCVPRALPCTIVDVHR